MSNEQWGIINEQGAMSNGEWRIINEQVAMKSELMLNSKNFFVFHHFSLDIAH